MARTGEAENKTANQQLAAQQAAMYGKTNAAIDAYNKKLGDFEAGNYWVENPYLKADYLENQNRLAATGAHATSSAGAQQLEDTALRTGNNSASTTAAIKNIARQANQDAQTRQTQQSADDYNNWINMNESDLGWTLAPTGASNAAYGTATSGRSQALGNLTQLGMASYGPWNAAIGAAGAAVGGYYSGKKSGGGSNI